MSFKMAASRSYQCLRISLLLLCIMGIVTSIYAYYVETLKESNANYKAACDISEFISCSKVFTSRYGRGFGLLEYVVGKNHWINQPNSVFGIIFYVLQLIFGETHTVPGATVQLTLAVLANLGSVYLAYILYFVLKDFCIVCVSMYIINFLILFVSYLRRRHLVSVARRRQTKSTKKYN